MYRNKKKEKDGLLTKNNPGKERRTYSCKKCGKAISDGNHRQVKGKYFCPFGQNGDTFEEFRKKILEQYDKKENEK